MGNLTQMGSKSIFGNLAKGILIAELATLPGFLAGLSSAVIQGNMKVEAGEVIKQFILPCDPSNAVLVVTFKK